MKTPELPDGLAELLESFCRRRGQRWAEELEELLRQLMLTQWDEALQKPGPKAARLSEEETERLTVEGVREKRLEHNKPFHTPTFSLGRALLSDTDDVAEALAASEGEAFR